MNVFGIMKPGDWILIVCAFIISIVSAALVWMPSRAADAGVARIYVDNELLVELPLDTDCEYTVENGEDINVVEISSGRAHIKNANCADEYCVKQGYIEYSGDTLICLPHRLVVELAAGKESALDAIAS